MPNNAPHARKLTLCVALIVALSITAATAVAEGPSSGVEATDDSLFAQDAVPGEVIVQFKQDRTASEREATIDSVDARVESDMLLPRTKVIEVETGQEADAVEELEDDPDVVYAEVNGIVHATAIPDDRLFTDLWGLNNTGQEVDGVTGVADADIDAPEAWNMGAGLGPSVRVAVVDTGVARNHLDLAQNMFTNPGESGGGKETNGIDDDGNGFVDDFRGWDFYNNDNDPADDHDHGTHVAGTIAARANNGLGVAGVASFPTPAGEWAGPQILAIKVLSAGGSGSFSTVADGLAYAGTMNAKVANVSLGGGGTSTTLDNAINSRPNTLYAIAAGNSSSDNDASPSTPCVSASLPDAPNKLCVAATDSSDQLAGFSNFGATNVDLAAPGVRVLSSVRPASPDPDTAYSFFDGTSMAAPHVAGAAAFLFAKFPTATVAQIKAKILAGVDPKGSLAGKVATGGRLNLYKAAAESRARVRNGVLAFIARPGQTNRVTVMQFNDGGIDKYLITDPYSTSTTEPQSGSRIIPGAGCQRVDDHTVKCPVAGITRIVVVGDDLDDTLSASTITIPVTLNGGAGMDTLVGGANGDLLGGGPDPDQFTAGTGNDLIKARNDDFDTLFSCGENPGDSDTVKADSTPDESITASADDCERVRKG